MQHQDAKPIDVFYLTLNSVPVGRFTTYGTLAKLCGVHVRQIQAWLRKMPRDSGLPWYRIINGQFRIAEHPGSANQHKLLAAEGLLVNEKGRFPKEKLWPEQ